MLQKLGVWRPRSADPAWGWISLSWLALVVGGIYMLSARLSLSLLTPEGVAVFWPAAGVAAGALIALGPRTRWAVVAGTMVATVVANLLGDRNLVSSIVFAVCNAAEALLTAGLIERYFGLYFSLDRLSQVLGLLVAIPLAILCAVKSGSALDRFLTGLAFGKLSLPSFMVAILLIYLFAVELNWLPATGWVPFAEDPLGNLRSFVLPALTLAFAEWPVLMRVLRSDMIATLQEDYIAMAKAKGLRPARILLVHALKPSSLTLVTVTGINIGRLIGGALIVETIFALPGVGRLLVGAIYARDFIILQGVVLFVAVGFVIVNFVVDLLYAVLDPRIRHGRA